MTSPWDVVFNTVRPFRRPGYVYPPPLSDRDLDAVDLGAPLPLSYRAFALRFGLGGWCGACLLPFDRSAEEIRTRGARGTVVGETKFLRANVTAADGAFGPLISRCLCFAYAGHSVEASLRIYVWDPSEVTEPTENEYAIYEVTRSYASGSKRMFANGVNRVTDRFDRFLAGHAALGRWLAPGQPEIIGYTPLVLRVRHKPGALTVAKWLAWNNNTARDLALSIRDHGRTDAFPILADALQEAGCTNADLLDSCRTGDPDIDGAWVLQVLLGQS